MTNNFVLPTLRLPHTNAPPQPPDPFVIFGPGTPPRTRVEFSRFSHRISVIALSDALIRSLVLIAKHAVSDPEVRPIQTFTRLSNDGIAVVVRNAHVSGHDMTVAALTDVLWTLWQFACEFTLVSTTFTVEYDDV